MDKHFKTGLITVAIYLLINAIAFLIRMFIFSIDSKGVPSMLIDWFIGLINLPGVIVAIPGMYSPYQFGVLITMFIVGVLFYFIAGTLLSVLFRKK